MSARILVVDDIAPNVKLLEAKLTSDYYDVITATNGPEALEKIKTESPDLVLLDVMMPGMDGFEVCSKIKADGSLVHIPVIMVTALTDPEDKVRGLEAGADDFLSKPIDDTSLMARVRSLVRLKMAMDEWRVRENTATQLGMVEPDASVMKEPTQHAKILVIDDKEFSQRKIMDALQVDQHDVICVHTGTQAMEQMVTNAFDMIIVSLSLENEDGLRLCSHFKSNEKTRTVPILMAAEEEEMERVVNGLEIGVHDYILRPIDKNEMLARTRTQIRRKRFHERLRATYETSLSMALIDSLTGLYNRRYLEVHLQKLLNKNERSNKALAILMVDIDNFKQVNDTYGHAVGDQILKIFAERLKDGLRSFDLVARMGGEEFVVILPDVSHDLAYIVAERLRTSIAEKPITCDTPDGCLSITTSIGGAIINSSTDMLQTLDRADKQLYEAKEAGRNCTFFEKVGRLDPAQYQSNSRGVIE